MPNITTKTARDRLPKRQEPYWTPLSKGSFLGYRTHRAATGTWLARFRDRDGKQHWKPIGEHPDFSSAKAEAEKWLAQMGSGSRRTPSRGTVRAALAAYLQHLRNLGRRDTARDAAARFHLIAGRDEAFGAMRLEDVTRDDVESWRNRLRKGRANRSVNRQVRAVVAALNCAVEERGFVGDPRAWTLTQLADDKEESGETALFLTSEQRARLLEYAPPGLEMFLRGLSYTGARPSELAAATVADFDDKAATVTLRHRKGRPAKLKARAVMLDDSGLEFFRSVAKGKTPAAPLIGTEEGGAWARHQWSLAIRATAATANKKAKGAHRLPVGVNAYAFRHARISELLQVYKVDPLTVAQQTGTSVAMMEKAYFKFIPNVMREKLNAVKSA